MAVVLTINLSTDLFVCLLACLFVYTYIYIYIIYIYIYTHIFLLRLVRTPPPLPRSTMSSAMPFRLPRRRPAAPLRREALRAATDPSTGETWWTTGTVRSLGAPMAGAPDPRWLLVVLRHPKPGEASGVLWAVFLRKPREASGVCWANRSLGRHEVQDEVGLLGDSLSGCVHVPRQHFGHRPESGQSLEPNGLDLWRNPF